MYWQLEKRDNFIYSLRFVFNRHPKFAVILASLFSIDLYSSMVSAWIQASFRTSPKGHSVANFIDDYYIAR
jgi:hypothetical protein